MTEDLQKALAEFRAALWAATPFRQLRQVAQWAVVWLAERMKR